MSVNVQARAYKALAVALNTFKERPTCDKKGYVRRLADNLIDGVAEIQFMDDFAGGAGRELEGKMRAAYSSSALAVNCFARWRTAPVGLRLAGHTNFDRLQFEAKCPTGLQGGMPPHLDLLLTGPNRILAVESKCTEHLTEHTAIFSDAYRKQITDGRRESGWFQEMETLRAQPHKYRFLDAAQLIKHYFGLARTYPDREVTLLYLFWEPANADDYLMFAEHRQETAVFLNAVAGSPISFTAQSYPELWAEWSEDLEPSWLKAHLANLRARYEVEI